MRVEFAPLVGGRWVGLTFTELVGAMLAANILAFCFIGAWIQAGKHPGFSQPFIVWVGLVGPLLFILSTIVTAGP